MFDLAEALIVIANDNFMNRMLITSISYEDGSKRKFNYSTRSGNYFAELSECGSIIRNTYR